MCEWLLSPDIDRQFTQMNLSMHSAVLPWTTTLARLTPNPLYLLTYYYYYYYYSLFMAVWILFGTTRVGRYQKPIWSSWNKRQWVAVASAGPYANLHLTPAPHDSVFTGRMPFLSPNQWYKLKSYIISDKCWWCRQLLVCVRTGGEFVIVTAVRISKRTSRLNPCCQCVTHSTRCRQKVCLFVDSPAYGSCVPYTSCDCCFIICWFALLFWNINSE